MTWFFDPTVASLGGATAYTITADSGTYTISGTAVATKLGRKVVADSGSYAINGTAVALRRNLPLVVASGSYAISGTAVSTLHQWKVAAASGSYAINGTAVSLEYGRGVVADAGAYAINGTAVTLTLSGGNKVIAADSGSYAISGASVSTLLRRLAVANSGSYEVSGSAVTLTYAPAVASSPPVTTAGRRSAATSYAYKTLGNIRRDKERELAKIARRAQRKVEAALATEPPQGLAALVRQEVTATAPKGVQWLSPAVLNGIVESIIAYQRAQMERDLIRRQQEDEEDDIEALLLAA